MPFRRAPRSMAHRRPIHWEWARQVVNNAAPSATLNNEDLLGPLKTKTGISINFPEIVIWRIRLRVSIIFTVATTLKANDGILVTSFVDDTTQVLLNQSANPLSEHDLVFDQVYGTASAMFTNYASGAATFFTERVYDLKGHRKLDALDNTLWLQLASTGQAQVTGYSYQSSILMKFGRG